MINWNHYHTNYYREDDSAREQPRQVIEACCPHCLKYIYSFGVPADIHYCPYCGISLRRDCND